MSGAIDVLIGLGYKARRDGRLDEAKQLFSESLALCREAAIPVQIAVSLTGLGQIERDLKNNDLALQHYTEAADIYHILADPQRLAHAVRHVADILRHEGSVEQARSCYKESLAIYRSHSETTDLDLANTLRGVALLSEESGEIEQAKALWSEAKNLYDAASVAPGVQECAARLADS